MDTAADRAEVPAAHCRRLRRGERALRHARRVGRPRHAGAHLPGLVAEAAVPTRRAGRPVGGHDRAHRRARRPAGGGRRAATGGRDGRLAARRAAGGPRRGGRGRPGYPRLDVPRAAARVLVDPRREHEVLVHRADAALALGLDYRCPPSGRPTASPSSSACWRRARPIRPTVRSPRGPLCTCTPPTTGSARRGSGSSVVAARASGGSTGTPRATSPSAARPSTSCSWRCAADRPTASRRSATPPCGSAG